MSSAIGEVFDTSNEFSSKFKRKMSSTEEKCVKKPKLYDTKSGKGFKEISSDCLGGDETDNSSTVKKLKTNKLNLKNNDILALLNSSDSDVDYNKSDSDESLTADNDVKKTELSDEAQDLSSNSCTMEVVFKEKSNSNENLKKSMEVCESSKKSRSSNQVSSDNESSSDSEDSDSDSCIKSSKDECIVPNGKLKLSKREARIKRNSKPVLNIRRKNTINVSTSDSSDDEPLSTVIHSNKPEENTISSENKILKKLGNTQKGVNGNMLQGNLKNRKNHSKQKVDYLSDYEDEELKTVKNETSCDSSDAKPKMTSEVTKQKVIRKRHMKDQGHEEISLGQEHNKNANDIRRKNTINESTSESSDDEPLSKVIHYNKSEENTIGENKILKKLGNTLKGANENMLRGNLKNKKNHTKQKVDCLSDSEELKTVKNETSGDSSDAKPKRTSVVTKRKVIRKRHMKGGQGHEETPSGQEYNKNANTNIKKAFNNSNSYDKSTDSSDIDSNEEMQETPKKLKVKQLKNDPGGSDENTMKEKSSDLKLEKLSSDSDAESRVVSDEDIKEQKPRKVQATKNQKYETSNSEEETSDKEGNLKSRLVKHEISSSESSSEESGMNKTPKENEKMKSKKLPEDDKRIINLKKYLHIAGIRPKNYAELWKGCRSNKARAMKLHELLEKNGLKGRPTIEKCKKLRKKIETEKEIAELDLGNIMEDGGVGRRRRCTRGVLGNTNSRLSMDAEEKAEELKNRFSRIKALNSSSSETD